jgi:Copper type II ascorbate-dependent monooxygenase, N-terminal domain/Secretion system C-terminal sorting domain/Copper type II ascorbate-dependent monooxygenase, C-terminal domain
MMRNVAFLLAFWSFFPAAAQTPTWSDDVACIVYSHCAPCHHEGGPGHFNLTSYVDGYWWRNEMRDATQARFMPPWPPDPNYRSLAHERVLTQTEIDIIAAWVDGGAPEGDPQNAPVPPVFVSNAEITAPDISAIMQDYTIPASTADNYRCFVLPINNPTDRYITGLEVLPGNTEMVHHVLVFQDATGEAQALDDASIEPGYESFGGIGVDDAKLIGIWAPGASAYFTPTGMGLKLLANANIVIQVHYPATSTVEVDSTRINIQLAPPGFQRELALDPILDHVVTITDGPLLIAPNVVDTFHAQYTIPIPGTITAVAPHSHLLGKRMTAWAVTPGGETIPIIDIPRWDFRWQGLYSFRNPIFLPQGTTLHCETVYDNTVNNPFNPNDPPDWVWLGEATTNEMMLYYFMWTYGFNTDENIVVDDSPHMTHHLDCVPDINIGIGEEARMITGSVWPSPAREQITVTTSALGAELRLIDIGGRVVLRRRISSGQQQIGVSPLARGIYTVELVGEGAPWRTKVLLE